MAKSADAFRTISEVAEWLDTPAHVLRFWESKFTHVKPVKRAGGRRYYRPSDMKLLGGIKKLLHDDGLTIKGVQKLLREQGVGHVAALSQALGDAADDEPYDVTVSDVEPQKKTRGEAPERPDTSQAKDTVEAAKDGDPVAPVDNVKTDTSDIKPLELPADPAPLETIAPVMPSFHHRSSAPTTDAASVESSAYAEDQSDPDPEPVPEPAALKPILADVPDDPDDAVSADPGLLTALASLPQPLSLGSAARLKPIVDRLRARASSAQSD